MEIKDILEKPYTENQRLNFIVSNNHKKGYEIKETDARLEAWGSDEAEILEQTKQIKIARNDELRDNRITGGVLYKGILFDSDTDQKVNLLAVVSTLENPSPIREEGQGEELKTIIWYGKDNQPLECSKEDLINIGRLITELHTFCWNKNAEIKALINKSQNIEEVEAIEINYERGE